MSETTMAATVTAFGDPTVLQWQPYTLPPLTPDSVQVKTTMTAINPIDLGTRAGRVIAPEKAHFPMVLGWSLCGEVETIGSKVKHWRPGDKVVGFVAQPRAVMGTYSEKVIMQNEGIAAYPEGASPAVAALLPLPGLTAYSALEALNLQPGESLFINGILGTVGSIAAQLAIRRGINVVGSIRLKDMALARQSGVKRVIDRDQSPLSQLHEQVDAALDVVGGHAAQQAFQVVKDGGKYATIAPEWWVAGGIFTSQRGIVPQVIEKKDPQHLAALTQLLQRGELFLPEPRTMPLKEAAQAHYLIESGQIREKIVLETSR